MAGTAKKYQNEAGVTVTAEQITDPNDEHNGFWLTTDKSGTQGRVPDDLFKTVFTEVQATSAKSTKKGEA
jgi:hypothetical protein